MDTVIYRNKLQHWYYLFDKKDYVNIYGELPEVNAFPKPVYNPDELGDEITEEEKKFYYPEFYGQK